MLHIIFVNDCNDILSSQQIIITNIKRKSIHKVETNKKHIYFLTFNTLPHTSIYYDYYSFFPENNLTTTSSNLSCFSYDSSFPCDLYPLEVVCLSLFDCDIAYLVEKIHDFLVKHISVSAQSCILLMVCITVVRFLFDWFKLWAELQGGLSFCLNIMVLCVSFRTILCMEDQLLTSFCTRDSMTTSNDSQQTSIFSYAEIAHYSFHAASSHTFIV